MEYACPNCGSKNYTYHYSESTCLGWAQVYEDGKLVSSDPNVTTHHLTCSKCKHNFRIAMNQGKILEIYDDGVPPQVPTLEIPITVETGDSNVENNTIEYKPIETKVAIATVDDEGQPVRTAYSWELEIGMIKSQMGIIQSQVATLESQVDKILKSIKGILNVLEYEYS